MERITPEGHRAWFAKRRISPETRLYIAETAALTPVGQIRFDRHEPGWEIDYSIAPAFRGRRLAAPLLRAGMLALGKEFPGATVVGRVKTTNQPSLRTFRALGFSRTADSRGEIYTATVPHE
jgi:RimJ/RimL family protein N-acetyltransferase